jgi:hypothetical protein
MSKKAINNFVEIITFKGQNVKNQIKSLSLNSKNHQRWMKKISHFIKTW